MMSLPRLTLRVVSAVASATQSFDFLVDVADFKLGVHAAVSPGEDFHKYLAIVKEYVESNALSEVHMACKCRELEVQRARLFRMLTVEKHYYSVLKVSVGGIL